MKKLISIVLMMFVMVALPYSFAFAYLIDGFINDWNVDISDTAVGADIKEYLDNNTPYGGLDIDYITEDITDKDAPGLQPVGPGYSPGNTCDAEAMYFDNDSTFAYIAIVTGLPSNVNNLYIPGDIGIDIDGDMGYEYALNISDRHLYLVNPVIIDDPLVDDWEKVEYSKHAVSDPWRIKDGNGTDKGEVDFIYSTTPQMSHYVLETKIRLNYLGLDASATRPVNLHWTMHCGNDYLNLPADINAVPEPGSVLLFGLSTFGFGILRKRRNRRI